MESIASYVGSIGEFAGGSAVVVAITLTLTYLFLNFLRTGRFGSICLTK